MMVALKQFRGCLISLLRPEDASQGQHHDGGLETGDMLPDIIIVKRIKIKVIKKPKKYYCAQMYISQGQHYDGSLETG